MNIVFSIISGKERAVCREQDSENRWPERDSDKGATIDG